jgi:hypothetical protein
MGIIWERYTDVLAGQEEKRQAIRDDAAVIRNGIAEEQKKLLRRHGVTTLEEATEVLTEKENALNEEKKRAMRHIGDVENFPVGIWDRGE